MNIIKDFVSLLRVKHWIKNLFIFIPLFFAGKMTHAHDLFLSVCAFFAFSFASSVVYIINDLADIEADRLHPRKKNRPIPAGRISPRTAILIAACMFIAAGAVSVLLVSIEFTVIVGSYLLLNIAYSFWGKHVAILDVLFLAVYFVLRVIAGSFAISVEPSGWMIMTTFFISLFLGFGKRRNEYISLKKKKGLHRRVLEQYDVELLNHYIFASCAIAIISYALYTLSGSVIERFPNGDRLVYTIPFLTYSLFRYVFFIWKKGEGDPTEVIFRDPGVIASVLACALIAIGIIYLPWRL